jgi:hypothetical protein
MRYGPWRSIWLCAMGHGEKPITIAQNCATLFKSLAISLKGAVMLKKCMYINSTTDSLHHPSFTVNTWYLRTKIWFPAVVHSAVQISNSNNLANSNNSANLKQNLKKM